MPGLSQDQSTASQLLAARIALPNPQTELSSPHANVQPTYGPVNGRSAGGTLVACAEQMGHTEAADLLEETLEEEKSADDN